MLFSEAVTRIKSLNLPDESDDSLGELRILQALTNSSNEIAANYGLNRTRHSQLATAGSRTISLNMSPLPPYKVTEVTLGDWQLAALTDVQRRIYDFVSGPPRYYTWERTTPTRLDFAPAPQGDSTLRFIYFTPYIVPNATSTAPSFSIWNNKLPTFHDIVINKAVARLLDAQYLYEEAGRYDSMAQAREAELAAHLQGLTKDGMMALQMQQAGAAG